MWQILGALAVMLIIIFGTMPTTRAVAPGPVIFWVLVLASAVMVTIVTLCWRCL